MKPSEQKSHSVIFTSVNPPESQEETDLLEPIRIVPVNRRQKLDPTARLNYAKLYTIEYNVEVWFIGHIDPGSEQQLVDDYNSIHTLLPDRRKAKSRTGKETKNLRRNDFGSRDASTHSPSISTAADRFPQSFPVSPGPEDTESFDTFPGPQYTPSIIHPSSPSSYQSSYSQQPPDTSEYSARPQTTSYTGSSRRQKSHLPPFNQPHASSSNYVAGSQRNYPSSSSYQPTAYERDDDLDDE